MSDDQIEGGSSYELFADEIVRLNRVIVSLEERIMALEYEAGVGK